jgi:Fe-S-cluster containining protein
MENLINDWRARSEKEQAQVTAWLDATKGVNNSDRLESSATAIGNEVTNSIDCLDCGNCCKTSVTDFTKGDIKKAAKHLKMTPKGFIKQYLMEDIDGTYITITSPCPMLNADNTCKIYAVRPKVCESYPHIHRGKFANRSHAHKANLDMCPITYHTIKKMMEVLG